MWVTFESRPKPCRFWLLALDVPAQGWLAPGQRAVLSQEGPSLGTPAYSLAPHLLAADDPWPGCVNPLAHSETAHTGPPSPNDCLDSAIARKDYFIYVRNTESPGQHWAAGNTSSFFQ